MPERSTITIALVDDDSLVRAALTAYLAAADGFTIVHQCTNGADALQALHDTPVDVVVMDMRMPIMDGITATRTLKQIHPDTKVLLLTSFDEDEAVRKALAAGANGFLLKDTSPDALVDGIRAVVHDGTSVVSPGPIARLFRTPASRRQPLPFDAELSPRELQILQLLCAAYSNAEIAEELSLSDSTVKTHVSALMSKLGVTSRLKAVVRGYELGLVERT